jgi:hypothetical protein
MKLFNSMLDVGMKAMIIGVRLPENSHLIGKVVTVECFLKGGELIPAEFVEKFGSVKVWDKPCNYVVVSGLSCKKEHWRTGYRMLDPKNLMPLPPLEDDEFQESSQQPKKEFA